jgi:hypothetical protein
MAAYLFVELRQRLLGAFLGGHGEGAEELDVDGQKLWIRGMAVWERYRVSLVRCEGEDNEGRIVG